MQAARELERRLAPVVAVLIATVLASGVAALAGSHHAAAGAPTTPPVAASTTGPAATTLQVTGVDIVPPTPVSITVDQPQQPRPQAPDARTPATPAAQPAAHQPQTVPATAATCAGSGWQQRRGAAALASLLHPAPAGVSIAFLPGRGGLKGMTYYDSHHVDVFVGDCAAESDTLLRHVVAHELGHAWDSLHMTDALRADYLAARGIAAGTPWFGCNGCQDFATPAGDFAETYAQWQRGAADSRSRMAAPATAAQLADLGARFFSS